MFYKDPCPKCGRPVARGRGTKVGNRHYHPEHYTCAHGVQMDGPECPKCNLAVSKATVEV